MSMLKWDFSKLSTVKYQTSTYELKEKFNKISIVTDTADIVFLPSENTNSKVICYEEENCKHSVSVKDDTLMIEITDTRKWYGHIGITFDTPKITVYLPQNEYTSLVIKGSTGDVNIPDTLKLELLDVSLSTGYVKCYASASDMLKIKTSTGDIHVENAFYKAIDLSVSTGRVTVNNVVCDGEMKIKVNTGNTALNGVKCKSLTSDGSTGKITLQNVIASDSISIKRDTGDVIFDKSDAMEIFVETDTGSVKGSLLTDKTFITRTDTGSVKVPHGTSGGRCEITTDTGDIRLEIIS
jgi:DUF4097 and DUF4098 domain-containing protein YvlB